jgi:hypothetical protein
LGNSSDYSCEGSKKFLFKQLENFYQWKDKISSREPPNLSPNVPKRNFILLVSHASKRRRVRGTPVDVNGSSSSNLGTTLQDDLMAEHCKTFLDGNNLRPTTLNHIQVRTVNGNSCDLNWSLLDSIRPHWVIMYSPNMEFVRKLEIYKASNPDIDLKVYLMVYDNSIEEQQYLTLLRREKESFEKLIHQKSVIMPKLEYYYPYRRGR